MHFLVTWSTKPAGPRGEEIDTAMKEALAGFSWVRVLPNTYVVRVGGSESRVKVREKLLATCKLYDHEVNFIVTPLMQGGTYGGYLPASAWPKIRERAREE